MYKRDMLPADISLRMRYSCGRTPVVVTNIYRDDTEVSAAKGGENLRLRLTGVDEDEMQVSLFPSFSMPREFPSCLTLCFCNNSLSRAECRCTKFPLLLLSV